MVNDFGKKGILKDTKKKRPEESRESPPAFNFLFMPDLIVGSSDDVVFLVLAIAFAVAA